MAKRRKEKDEEEDKPFKLPKFDEKKFVKNEKRKIKTTFIAFLFGILIALLSFGFWVLLSGNGTRWILVLIFGIFTGSWLKYIFTRLKIDLTDFEKKNWFGAYAVYFLSWFIVLILLTNPPFYDDEKPLVNLQVLPEIQEPGGDILVIAKITDNTELEKEDITLKIDGTEIPQNDFEYKNTVLRYTYQGPDNINGDETHDIELTVNDGKYETVKEKTITFSNDTIELARPDSGDEIDLDDTIRITALPKVTRVYYTVDNGIEINTSKSKDTDYYITSAQYKGWPKIINNSLNISISAEIVYYFQNIDEKFSNYINDSTKYTLSIEKDEDINDIGEKDTDKVKYPKKDFVQAPGFELIALLAAFSVVFIIYKKHKKNKDKK